MAKKRNNHHGDGKDGGEPARMTKSDKKLRATTVDAATVDATTVDASASSTETALPNATNLGEVFDEAANNTVPAPESSSPPDATSIHAVREVTTDNEEPAGTTGLAMANTTTDEPHFESFQYDLPFTIFERFDASKCPWAIDVQPLNAQQLFSASGERRRKEVKNDFEWLHPTTRPADIAAAREAYQSKYSLLHDGI